MDDSDSDSEEEEEVGDFDCLGDYLLFKLAKHRRSYDKVERPEEKGRFNRGRMNEPWIELHEREFFNCIGMCKDDFCEIADSLTLLDEKLITKTGCTASRRLGLFVVLSRWRKKDNFEGFVVT
jgi:hypothetical protein